MNISDIQNIIKNIFSHSVKLRFLKIRDISKFGSLNMIFGFKNLSHGKIKTNINLSELHNFIFKKISEHQNDDLKIFTKENIIPFIIKKPLFVYKSLFRSQYKDSVKGNRIDWQDVIFFTGESPYWMVAIDCEMVETINFDASRDSSKLKNSEINDPIHFDYEDIFEFDNSENNESYQKWGIGDNFNEILDVEKHFIRAKILPPAPKQKIVKRASELGRITILDHNGSIIYDKFVKPSNFVSDYRTKYSGITKTLLDCGVSFETMQNEIKNIIGANTVIVGHSLENELKAMKFYHPLLIDTAYLFSDSNNEKIKLKELARKYLKKQIQVNEHCSIE
ncbi:Small RNA degrading nuclease 5, partial [Dictyocoela muelleri]